MSYGIEDIDPTDLNTGALREAISEVGSDRFSVHEKRSVKSLSKFGFSRDEGELLGPRDRLFEVRYGLFSTSSRTACSRLVYVLAPAFGGDFRVASSDIHTPEWVSTIREVADLIAG